MNKVMVSVAIAFVLISMIYCRELKCPPQSRSFQEYWTEFRAAVLNNDVAKVVLLTRFPFKTRGSMDWDKVLRHNKKWFLKMYPKLLAIDPGLSAEPDTTRALIERTAEISKETRDGDDRWRLGDFVFEKIKGRWFFTMAYWDSEG